MNKIIKHLTLNRTLSSLAAQCRWLVWMFCGPLFWIFAHRWKSAGNATRISSELYQSPDNVKCFSVLSTRLPSTGRTIQHARGANVYSGFKMSPQVIITKTKRSAQTSRRKWFEKEIMPCISPYYPTLLIRVQRTRETSKNISLYLRLKWSV